MFRPGLLRSSRKGSRRAALVLAMWLAAVVAAPLDSLASTWTIDLDLSFGATPAHVTFQVQLADPSGSTTVNLGGVPVTVRRTADRFSLSTNAVVPGVCITTLYGAGGAPIQTGTGNSVASGGFAGGTTQSCSSGPSEQALVIVGYTSVFVGLESDFDLLVPIYAAPGGGETVTVNASISGSFRAQSAGIVPAAQPGTVSGTVTFRTPLGGGPLGGTTDLTAGLLIQTGADGNASLVFRDNTRLTVFPNSQVTIPRLATATSLPSAVTLLRGRVALVSDPPTSGGAAHPGVNTPTVKLRPIGTEYSADYGQSGTLGSTVVDVVRGIVEVADRHNLVVSLRDGQRAVFNDSVPRVTNVLPVEEGAVVAGQANTFMWTRLPGGPSYRLEFTGNPRGFARPNSPTVELPANTLFVGPGTFIQSDNLVEFTLTVPAGLVPRGTRLLWRVFAVDGTGQVLPGTVASDASVLVVQ